MDLYHLNCATMNPPGKRLVEGNGGWLQLASLGTHCLLLETNAGLVLVDAGLSRKDVDDPDRLGRGFNWLMNPALDPSEPAYVQIEELGFDPSDVKHIIMTHLDIDHAGGIVDFPQANVHVLQSEYETAHSPPMMEKLRYRERLWAHQPKWCSHEGTPTNWNGFKAVAPIPDQLSGLKMVSLPGHSAGHCGVAIPLDDGWLLHCGDAFFDNREMNFSNPECTVGLRLQQRVISHDNNLRIDTQKKLRKINHREENLQVICSHGKFNYQDDNRN